MADLSGCPVALIGDMQSCERGCSDDCVCWLQPTMSTASTGTLGEPSPASQPSHFTATDAHPPGTPPTYAKPLGCWAHQQPCVRPRTSVLQLDQAMCTCERCLPLQPRWYHPA